MNHHPEPAAVANGSPPGAVWPPLSRAEVRELWAFIHGDIMVAGIREHLRDSLGLCPRHTWGYAITEIELWVHGAGARGGHQPLDVCVLYSDLLAHVGARLTATHPFRSDLRPLLRASAPCRICEALQTTRTRDLPGFAGMNIGTLTDEANALTWTTAWLHETRSVWDPRSCPCCSPPSRPLADVAGEKHMCRVHLADACLTRDRAAAVGTRLQEVARRVAALAGTMSDRGRPATAEENASWIEALGWFAGWSVPLALTSTSKADG